MTYWLCLATQRWGKVLAACGCSLATAMPSRAPACPGCQSRMVPVTVAEPPPRQRGPWQRE